MKVKQLFALTALAIAGSAVLADEAPGAPLTRAEVVQSVLAARAAGTLMPAGQGEPGYPQAGDTTSNVTRAQVETLVLQARADGTLMPAGGSNYAPGYPKAGDPTTSNLTRAEVAAEVLQARADGELLATDAAQYGMVPVTHPTHAVATSGQNVASSGAK